MKTIKERTEKKKTSLDYKLRIDPSWLPDEPVMEQEIDDIDDDSYTYSMEELDVRTERALQESREGKTHSLRRCFQGRVETDDSRDGSRRKTESDVNGEKLYTVILSTEAKKQLAKHRKDSPSSTGNEDNAYARRFGDQSTKIWDWTTQQLMYEEGEV